MKNVIMISLFLLLFSCSKTDQSKDSILIGTWQTPNKRLTLNYEPEFVEITMLKGEKVYHMKGQWKTENGFLLETVSGQQFRTKYKVDGEKLTIQFLNSRKPTDLFKAGKG